MIVILVIVNETFSLHFAFAVGQYLVKQQKVAAVVVAVAVPEVVPTKILEYMCNHKPLAHLGGHLLGHLLRHLSHHLYPWHTGATFGRGGARG